MIFTRKLTTYKCFECQLNLNFGSSYFIGINFSIRRKCSHGGVFFDIILPFVFFEMSIFDVRHWDKDKNDWCDNVN